MPFLLAERAHSEVCSFDARSEKAFQATLWEDKREMRKQTGTL